MSHDHHHDNQGSALPEMDLRVRALESLLVEKGYVDPNALDILIDTYEHKVGPRNGARVVAKAWSDPAYRQWLLDDATAAIGSLGFTRPAGRAHGGARKHRPQCTTWSSARCVRAIRGRARTAARMVQVGAVPLAGGHRSARRAARIRRRPAARGRVARMGFNGRGPLSRAADAARGNRTHGRVRARGLGHARLDDRHGPAANAGPQRTGSRHERCARSWRHAGVRAESGRKPTTCRSTTMGAPRACPDARDGRDRQLEHRHLAPLAKPAAREYLGEQLLQDLVSNNWKQAAAPAADFVTAEKHQGSGSCAGSTGAKCVLLEAGPGRAARGSPTEQAAALHASREYGDAVRTRPHRPAIDNTPCHATAAAGAE